MLHKLEFQAAPALQRQRKRWVGSWYMVQVIHIFVFGVKCSTRLLIEEVISEDFVRKEECP